MTTAERQTSGQPDLDAAPSVLVVLESSGTTDRLTVRGALCAGSIAALEAQVDQLGCVSCRDVIIDLRHLSELDPIGANVILGLYHYVVGRGGELRVIVPPGRVAAVLRSVTAGVIPLRAG